jgi:hypothetical protein
MVEGKIRAEMGRLGFNKRRSPLWRYTRDHYRWFERMLAKGASWSVLAEALGKVGEAAYDKEGKSPTAETARQTFVRARREMEGRRKAEVVPKTVEQPAEVPVPKQPATPSDSPEARARAWLWRNRG